MEASQLPLDLSLNVNAKTAENRASMPVTPDKSSKLAFKVVTQKHDDGKLRTRHLQTKRK